MEYPVFQIMSQGSAKILVIDDDASVCSFLRRGLRLAGYQVQTAPNGTEGLSLADTFRPDLVILDRMMPGMDGFEVLARLREGWPGLRVLMFSGREEGAEPAQARPDAYLLKPVAFDILLGAVHQALGKTLAE